MAKTPITTFSHNSLEPYTGSQQKFLDARLATKITSIADNLNIAVCSLVEFASGDPVSEAERLVSSNNNLRNRIVYVNVFYSDSDSDTSKFGIWSTGELQDDQNIPWPQGWFDECLVLVNGKVVNILPTQQWLEFPALMKYYAGSYSTVRGPFYLINECVNIPQLTPWVGVELQSGEQIVQITGTDYYVAEGRVWMSASDINQLVSSFRIEVGEKIKVTGDLTQILKVYFVG